MSIGKRLEEIRKSIKLEPIEFSNNEESHRFGNYRQVPGFHPNPSNNNEALREQFLNKTLSASNVIGALSGKVDTRNIHHETNQIAGVYNRAEDINARLRGNLNNSSFYAHIPENLNEPTIASRRHESPLVQNNNNAMFNFQASTDNVKDVMLKSNPHRDIPYKVHSTAKNIGANIQLIKKSLEECEKRKIPPPPAFSEVKSRKVDSSVQPSTSKESSTNDRVSCKEMKDKCVETTVNTGSLKFEITSNELENLSEEKKVILLEFMKAFNIRDSREVKSIRERLKHRLANQENKRKQYQSTYGSYPPTYGPPI
ncbi:uncharacterized protein [Chironomus tepperi]|uniref:uncharacterized protein n=1 Tax=Chironomus tepperi TaxID=113505 RepID=UPI00391FBEF8